MKLIEEARSSLVNILRRPKSPVSIHSIKIWQQDKEKIKRFLYARHIITLSVVLYYTERI
jgi:hypothetical protein